MITVTVIPRALIMDEIPNLVEELTDNVEFHVNNINYDVQQPKVANPDDTTDHRVPITIITGYLGSGKSTLLQKISKTSNKRLAIILNEFGDSLDVEKAITIKDTRANENVEEWLDLGNGCLCCTVKDNGVTAIEQLIANSKHKIDYILLETTGIADPGPIANMFWLDQGLASNVYIDGVITVVDAENIITCLEDIGGHWHLQNNYLPPDMPQDVHENLQQGITTAHLQISLADAIIINKTDLVEPLRINTIREKIKSINNSSAVYETKFGEIELEKILDLHAFEADVQTIIAGRNSFHDDRIITVTVTTPFFTTDESFAKVEKFIQHVLWDKEINGQELEIHRLKGILVNGTTGDVRVVQAVRETYDIIKGGRLLDEIKHNKLIFIGKNLHQESLEAELATFLGSF